MNDSAFLALHELFESCIMTRSFRVLYHAARANYSMTCFFKRGYWEQQPGGFDEIQGNCTVIVSRTHRVRCNLYDSSSRRNGWFFTELGHTIEVNEKPTHARKVELFMS